MDRALEVRGAERGEPRAVVSAPSADLGYDHQIIWIGKKGLANKLVGDVRAIEIAGVNVIYPVRHGRPQYRKRRVPILRWSEHAGPGKLHGS